MRRTAISVAVAAAAAALAVLTWWLSFRTGIGHRADVGAAQPAQPRVHAAGPAAELVATLCNTIPVRRAALLVIAAAVADRGIGGAAVIAAVLLVPNLVTQVLKQVTAEDRVGNAVSAAVHVDARFVAERARDRGGRPRARAVMVAPPAPRARWSALAGGAVRGDDRLRRRRARLALPVRRRRRLPHRPHRRRAGVRRPSRPAARAARRDRWPPRARMKSRSLSRFR